MADHIYRVIELAGSSEVSLAAAIENALTRASKTLRHLRWFEVTQMRGEIENGKVRHYQVTMKVSHARRPDAELVRRLPPRRRVHRPRWSRFSRPG